MATNSSPTNEANPIYSQYRNKNKQLISFLNEHNIRLSSSRTVNQLPAADQARLYKKAVIGPANERKLHKLVYSKPVSGLNNSAVDCSITAAGINTVAHEEEETLLSVKINSNFDMPPPQAQSSASELQNPSEEGKATSECLFIRHHNLVHFVDGNEKSTKTEVKSGGGGPGGTSSGLPMIYTSSLSSCSSGLAKHSRRFQINFI